METELRKGLLMKKLKQVDIPVLHTANEETDKSCGQDELRPLRSLNDKNDRLKESLNEATEFLPTWKQYFESNVTVTLPERSHRFNTYFTMPTNTNANSIPIFIFHHGAGSSGLTFAPLVKELAIKLEGACGAFSMDARGHGSTTPMEDQQSLDYTLGAFVDDFNAIIGYFYDHKLKDCVPQEKLSIIFIGHSLGGSICTSVYSRLRKEVKAKVVGIGMFDIVEEAAIAALKKMDNFLYTTPNSFSSLNDAIEYHVSHGLSNLRSSAVISIPPLFRQDHDGSVLRVTNLSSFRPFWHTWFKGLSHDFVKLPTSKLLVLAGSDNLDRELIIGQMQGKYQLVVFQESGHFIQEDAPTKAAFTLVDFWRRNDTKNYVLKTNWSSKH